MKPEKHTHWILTCLILLIIILGGFVYIYRGDSLNKAGEIYSSIKGDAGSAAVCNYYKQECIDKQDNSCISDYFLTNCDSCSVFRELCSQGNCVFEKRYC